MKLHIFVAACIALLMTIGWWVLLPFLPVLPKAVGIMALCTIIVGIFYRRLLKGAAVRTEEFFDFGDEEISSILSRRKWQTKRFRFFFLRATVLLTACFGGVGVGVVTLVRVWPVILQNMHG